MAMQTSPKLSQTALMVGAAAVALSRRSINTGAWRALAAPPACLPAARDSVDIRVPSFVIACANLAGRQLTNARMPWRFVRGLGAACYDNCKCLGFHWSEKLARCGLKADGNIPVRRLT